MAVDLVITQSSGPGATRTAAALTAAGPESVSPDDLAGITPLWSQAVQDDLLPVVAEVYQDSAGTVHAQLIDTAGSAEIPPVTSLASEAYLAGAANTFTEVGADLWETARSELLDGMAAGESIPELRDRLRTSAGLTGRTATLVARTQVLDASNAGSYDTARVSGLDLLKGWEATPDARTRPSHMAAGTFYQGESMIPLADPFTVGGFQCERPHDPSLPPAQRYSCRCTLIYAMAPVVPTPPEVQLSDLEARHAQRLAQIEAQHQARLAEAAARHAQRLAELDAADATEMVVQAAETRHAARLAKLAAGYEVRRAALLAEHDRRLMELRGGRPLPSAVGAEPAIPAMPGAGPTPVPVRASLVLAQTIPEVQRAFMREWTAIRRQHGHFDPRPSRFIPDGDVQTAREHAEGLLRAVERFPRVPMAVSHRTIPHYAQADLDTVTIQFGNGFARDRAAYLASLRQAGVRNTQGIAWHPMTIGSPQGVAMHEFGHLLHHLLSPLEPDPAVTGVTVFRVSTRVDDAVRAIVREMAVDRALPADELIKREIGEYAASNTHELIGEAFADAMVNGPGASVLSRRIMAVLVDEYDRTTGTGPRGPSVGRVLPSGPRPEPSLATVHLRPGASMEPSTWRAERIEGLSGPQTGVLTAVTSYVRRPGFVNTRLRTPEPDPDPKAWQTWLHEGSLDELMGRVPFDEVAEQAARKRADRLIAALDRVMDRSHTPAEMTVYRGADIADIRLPGPGKAAGFTWTDAGYVSTSSQRSMAAGSFGSGTGRVTLDIRLPRDTPALRIEGLGEDEVLLGRGLTFRVIEDTRTAGGSGRVVVEVVPSPTGAAVSVESGLARGVAEALQALTNGRTLTEIRAILEALPEAKDALTIARRATTTQGLTRSLNALATRRGLTLPSAKELKAIQTAERVALVAERKAARAAAAEAARVVRAEKARQAQVKRQVKAVEQGDFATLTRVGPQGGGMPGGLFEDAAGNRWYVKQAATEEHARSEALALALYRAAGLDAPEMVIGGGAPGLQGTLVATRWLPDAAVDLRDRLDDTAYLAEIREGFGMDALLANWDVVGANPAPGKGWDNIISSGGHPWRIEAGGALRYRGLGGKKGDAFGTEVLEWDTLRDPARAERASQVFAGMSREQLKEAVERVQKLTPTRIKALVRQHGLDPELVDLLVARRADLLGRALREVDPASVYRASVRAAVKDQVALDLPPVRVPWPLFGRRGIIDDQDREIFEALDQYRGYNSEPINHWLQTGMVEPVFGIPLRNAEATMHRWATAIDRAMDASPLASDVVVYRSLATGRQTFGTALRGDLTGYEWREQRYSSTSTLRRKSTAASIGPDRRLVMRILVPQGTKGVQLSPVTHEAEILLERDLVFRVVADRGFDAKGRRQLDVMVLPRSSPRVKMPEVVT